MRQRTSDLGTRSRLVRATTLLACGVALTAIGSACGSDEPAPSPDPSPAATTPSETVPPAAALPPTGEAPVGEASAPAVEIPEDFPTDVPVYPGASVGSADMMPGLGLFATFETDDAADDVIDHYRAGLNESGWSVTDAPDGTGVDGAKDNRSLAVRVRENEAGRTEIAIAQTDE